jgi:DNA polymerase-3 subunit delta
MRATALREAIHNKKFAPAYYFFGEDEYLKEEGLRRLIDAAVDPATRDFNLDQRKGGDLDAAGLSALLGSPPMMAERRMVVIKDVGSLKKDARLALDGYLKKPASDTLLVLTSPADGKADKGLSGSAEAVEFDQLSGAQVPKWITARAIELGATISPGASELLQDAVGPDLSQLAIEVNKLASYCGGREIDEAAVTEIVGVRREETLGRLLDAVATRDVGAALALVAPILQQPKTTAVFVVMSLTTQMLALAVMQASAVPMSRRSNEFFNLLKRGGSNLTGRAWGEAVSAWTRASSHWSSQELDHALHVLLQCDVALKGSRVSSEEQTLLNAILAMCGTGGSRRAA